MPKRRYCFDEEKIARFLKEGRGQGHGEHYSPWLSKAPWTIASTWHAAAQEEQARCTRARAEREEPDRAWRQVCEYFAKADYDMSHA